MLTTKKPDERKVYWYVDQKGGAGKSTFASYVLAKQQGGGTMIYTGGRKQDLAYAYNNERIVFFDLCRTDRDIEQTCKFMEELKNGRLFCTKYNSKLKLFKTPHVVVFSNNYPPYHAFSEDRIEIRVLEKNKYLNGVCRNATETGRRDPSKECSSLEEPTARCPKPLSSSKSASCGDGNERCAAAAPPTLYYVFAAATGATEGGG